MTSSPRSGSPARRARAASRAGTAVLAVALLAGCTSGSDDDPAPPAGSEDPTATGSPTPGAPEAAPVEVEVRVGQVAGRLPAGRRRSVVEQVDTLLTGFVQRAWIDGSDPDAAFRGFTTGAARLADRDRGLLTAGSLQGPLTVRAATAVVDVVAPRGRAVGATARLRLTVATDTSRRVRLAGRVLLTPRPDGWKVFGWDLSRARLAGTGGSR